MPDPPTGLDVDAERRGVHRGVRTSFAITHLRRAATAMIELRELTDDGPRAAWLDQQITDLIDARETLEAAR